VNGVSKKISVNSLIEKPMRYNFIIIILILILIFVCETNIVFAGSATLRWNANSESDLAGYRIYYGTSPRTGTNPGTASTNPLPKCNMCGYTNVIDVGKTSTPSSPQYTITNLTSGQTYYFSVMAYDTSGNESAFSSEVSKLISVTADLNFDGYVNSVDFGIMMSFWGSQPTKPLADINQDGYVNSVDFGILMSQWTN